VKIIKQIDLGEMGNEIRQIPVKIQGAAHRTLNLNSMVETARDLCPVDTTSLRQTIRAERRGPLTSALVAGGGGVINPKTGREVDYARYVHDGTSRTPPRPFLTQAVHLEAEGFASELVAYSLEALYG